jgi:hypothetical protein
MGLRPTHGDESAFLRPIGSKWVMRDFRRSAKACFASPGPGRFADGVAGSCGGLGVFRLI